jgi:phage baseplate assembly protein W
MAKELAAPFGLTPSGGIAVMTVPASMVEAHLKALVSTAPGERVMKPTYGVPVASYLFGLDAAQAQSAVGTDVTRAIQEWEPTVNIQDVRTLVSDTSEGFASINVEYTPGAAVTGASQVSTATVLVGGSVVGS